MKVKSRRIPSLKALNTFYVILLTSVSLESFFHSSIILHTESLKQVYIRILSSNGAYKAIVIIQLYTFAPRYPH